MIYAEIKNNGEISVYESTVSDSVKHETIKFKFPNEWSGYEKTVVFRYEDEVYNVVLNKNNDLCLSEDECYIPHEVIKSPMFTVSVFAVLGESMATSGQCGITVRQSGYELGDQPQDPTPGEYQQLVGIFEETKAIAESVRTDADNGLFKGDKGDKGDKGEKGDQVIQGEKGEKGDKGEQGDVNTAYLHNNFASSVKNSISGNAVFANDVSSVEHTPNIKLSSDTITDFSAVKVSRYGKNLLDISQTSLTGLVSFGLSCEIEEDDIIHIYGTSTSSMNYASFVILRNNKTELQGKGYIFSLIPISGVPNNSKIYGLRTTTEKSIAIQTNLVENTEYDIRLKIVLSIQATSDYEPYIEAQTVTASTDGTVEGILSLSPNMTILTNTDGVTVNMTYNADTKLYIDNKIAALT